MLQPPEGAPDHQHRGHDPGQHHQPPRWPHLKLGSHRRAVHTTVQHNCRAAGQSAQPMGPHAQCPTSPPAYRPVGRRPRQTPSRGRASAARSSRPDCTATRKARGRAGGMFPLGCCAGTDASAAAQSAETASGQRAPDRPAPRPSHRAGWPRAAGAACATMRAARRASGRPARSSRPPEWRSRARPRRSPAP